MKIDRSFIIDFNELFNKINDIKNQTREEDKWKIQFGRIGVTN